MTILEASKQLNCSKAAIRKYLTPEFRDQFCTVSGNGVIDISDPGFEDIKTKMGRNQVDTKVETPENQTTNQAETDGNQVEFLKKQVEFLNKQVESLQRQNESLTIALQNTTDSLKAAQVLHAADKPQLLVETTGNITENQVETDGNQKKKHWWNRKR